MRTTISVDDELLAAARHRASDRDQTLGQVIEDALRRELAQFEETEPVAVPVYRGGGGPLPGVDLTSNRAMRETLDESLELDALR